MSLKRLILDNGVLIDQFTKAKVYARSINAPEVVVISKRDAFSSLHTPGLEERIAEYAPQCADAVVVGMPVYAGDEAYVPVQYYELKRELKLLKNTC